MATTFRNVIDRVLRTVSEDEIDPVVEELSDDYQKLVATFVNQIKEEIEDAHNWRALRQTVTVAISADENVATIENANERSRLVRVRNAHYGYEVPLVFDITDTNRPIPLREMDLAEIIHRETMNTQANVEPLFFALDNTAGDVLRVMVYPTPTTARTLQLTLVIPQAHLNDDDLDVTIKIPTRALVMGSVWYALQERGEELGVSGIYTEERFRVALDDAIARDAEEQGGIDLIPV